MALTISLVEVFVIGDRKAVVADVTFDNNYPTDGEALTGTNLGLDIELNFVSSGAAMNAAGTSAVVTRYDHANSKLLAFESGDAVSTPLDEVGNTESLDGYVARVLAIGKGKAAV